MLALALHTLNGVSFITASLRFLVGQRGVLVIPIHPYAQLDSWLVRLAGELAAAHVGVDPLKQSHPLAIQKRRELRQLAYGKTGIFGIALKPAVRRVRRGQIVFVGP